MTLFSYTVAGTFQDSAMAEEWIAWLRDEHLAHVLAAGALDAEVVRLDPDPSGSARCEVRYHFASRKAFEAYERDHAPRLRAEGLKRFPQQRGIMYQRSTGEVCASL